MTRSGVPVVAAFDVDGTLTASDCVVPFLRRLGGRRGIVLAMGRAPVRTITALLRRDRDLMKDVVVGGVHRGRMVADVDAEGRRFAQLVGATMLRDDMVGRLRWHQSVGHRTVIVSASLRSYLVPLAESLGIDHLVCTDVTITGSRYQASLAGANCRGPEKAVRLRELLTSEGLQTATLWAYGDSRGDREMLAMAHHPVWVTGTTVTAVPDEEQQ